MMTMTGKNCVSPVKDFEKNTIGREQNISSDQ